MLTTYDAASSMMPLQIQKNKALIYNMTTILQLIAFAWLNIIQLLFIPKIYVCC